MLDSDGVVSVFDTTTNPSYHVTSWTTPPHEALGDYTCLALYEIASDNDDIEEMLAADKWLGVTLAAKGASHVTRQQQGNPLDERREGRSLLLAGTESGYLVLLTQEGSVTSHSRCPGNGAVVNMVCNPRKGQIISAGHGSVCVECN